MRHWRINLILFFILIFGAVIVTRLVFLQVLNHEFYSALAKGQQRFFAKEVGNRGEIFTRDKNGNLYMVATNKRWPFVYLSPGEKDFSEEDIKSIVSSLSEALNLDEGLIREKFKRDSLYEVVKTKLTDEEFERVKAIEIDGIYMGNEESRYYPYEDFFSQELGFLGGEGLGQYGLEEYWDKVLRGEIKTLEGERLAPSYLFFSQQIEEGHDLILTIDYNIQYQAEKLLKGAQESLNIEGGEIVVMDPSSGRIITMANFPNFDPNNYETYAKENNLEIFQNGIIQKIFEPGSVFKPITMAVALNEGRIEPWTTYEDKGQVKIGGYTIYNYDERIWGESTMTEVLEKSINTGAVFVQSKIPHNVFLDYIEKFGIFKKTDIDLPGEIFSQNKELKKGYEINFATASFGQGIEMTPIQLVRAFSVIANGGKMVKPYLVEEIVSGDTIIELVQPQISKDQIISSETSSRLSAMLVSVVENGFAKATKFPGYYIAGKTGTAQISWSAMGINKAGYSDETVQSFMGFFPAFNPQFLILVKLQNPETKTAEYSAVPIFKELAKYIIDYYQVPPDYE